MTEEPGRKRRRLIGIGFIIAFVLSTATIIYTGLNVRAPGSHRTESIEETQADRPQAAVPEDEDEGEAEASAPAR